MLRPEVLVELEALYDRGLYVTALRAAEAVDGGPLAWRDAAACAFASRLLHHVGAPRASHLLAIRAHRAAPLDPRAGMVWAHYLAGERGPYAALEYLRTFPVDAAEGEEQADLRLLRAGLLVDLRDFEAAEYEVCRAEALCPGYGWAAVARAGLLTAQDRLEDALGVAQEILRSRPWQRSAIQATAHALLELGRADEAATLLTEAVARLESGALALQLGHLEMTRRRPREAWNWFIRAGQLFVFIEPGTLGGLVGACCEAASEAGDDGAAIALARACGDPALARLADRLEQGKDRRVVSLDVPYVRQAHKTCAPATLSALCQFFGRPAEHLAIAEEICFDGTPWASERRWAEQQGLVAREFTVTWDSATALLDRGVPFALCTTGPTSAHEQAVAGYDARVGSFSVRDPSRAKLALFDVEALLTSQRWIGPRGLVLLPPDRARAIAGLELPDAALYDLHHAVEQALHRHDRAAAAAAVAELERQAPEHFLAAHAARSLAGYDENPAAIMAVCERLLARDPNIASLELTRLACLAALGRREERRARLEEIVGDRGGNPLFSQLLADDLIAEGDSGRAEALLLRLLKMCPEEPAAYRSLAMLRGRDGRWVEARGLLRLCACLEGVQGGAASMYVAACLHTGARAEALAFLRDRFERFGRRFSAPALTLHDALTSCDRADEALAVLDQALSWRPDDGALLLGAAEAYAAVGKLEQARELHARARGQAREVAWQRVAAQLDVQAGELAQARARYEALLEEHPLAIDVYRALAPLDAALDGTAAATARIDAAAARFPQNAALARLRAEWTPNEGEAGLAASRALVAAAPGDVDARGDLALRLARRGRHDEADAALAEVLRLAPYASRPLLIRAQIALWRQDRDEARAALRAALAVDVDAQPAIRMLVSLAGSPEARREVLGLAREELRRQVTRGPGIVAYREAAVGVEPPEDTLAVLEEALSIRPDLVASWTEVARQRTAMRRHEEARAIAEQAVSRFPLAVEAHLALAEVLGEAGASERQVAALEVAAALAPDASAPTLALASALHRAGQSGRAIEALERGLRRAPLEVEYADALAFALWSSATEPPGAPSQARAAAIARVIAALRIDPASEQRWQLLAGWASAAGEREGALAAAQALAEARPGSAWTRYGLALLLPDEDVDGTLAQLAEAVRLDPLLVCAHDLRVELLAGAKRWDEALAACAPPDLPEPLPLALRGRRAWLDARKHDVPEAVEQMRALVAEEPDYWFGWLCLANWAPKVSQQALARQSLGELLRLDPSRADVAAALLDAELTAQDFEAAERTLARLRALGEDDTYRDAALRLAFARGRGEGVVLFERLACTPGVPEAWLLRAAGEVGERIYQSHFDEMVARLIAAPGASPVVGYLWARWFEGGFVDRLLVRRRLRALRQRGAIGIEATAGHVERLALTGQNTSLALFVWLERATLRAHDHLWASVGYALLVAGWLGWARSWLADWQRRDGIEAWMLRHVVTALRAEGLDAEARLASERALASPDLRDGLRHRAWLALDAARAGPVDAAKAALAAAPVTAECEPFTRWLHARARSLVARHDPELAPEQRREKARVLALESEVHELSGSDARLAARLRRRLERAIA